MKIVFMGTPDFAVPTLEELLEAGHDVDLVITKPDAVRDRGKKVKFSPVKETALNYEIPVLQPETLKNADDVVEAIKKVAPDVICVVAYGKILPKSILELPRLGCINVHGSLLPKYRGAAPVQWSVICGEEVTGVTIMYMAEGMDTGDMLAKAETEVGDKTAGELSDELSVMGAELLVKVLEDLERGDVSPEKQDDSLATYAPMIFKKDGLLDFTQPAADLYHRMKGLSPWPGTYTYLDGELFKVWDAKAVDEEDMPAGGEGPGTVVAAGEEGILVRTGKGGLLLTEIQVPGKKRTRAADYLRGHSVEINTKLG